MFGGCLWPQIKKRSHMAKMRCLLILFLVINTNYTFSEKLSECRRCKVLTDSFQHWYQKTSRGKFEGGDVAWEEAKQKSYARSEVRLVEVQEGLCSELKTNQDHCYALAEEAEHPIEKWWFQEDPDASDLFTSLCIETLKSCCPRNHFGEFCDPCPLDVNNKVCGGRGQCDGDGTRRGKGTCLCKKGFTGQYCEECTKDFFRISPGVCEPCHEACDGCNASGANSCYDCKLGWKLEDTTCLDIDECAVPGNCKSNEFCINNPGSYSCIVCDKSCSSCSDAGASNCISCAVNYTFWNGDCVDDKTKESMLSHALQRVVLYFGFLLMALIVSRTSKVLASLPVVVAAAYIYISEQNNNVKTVDILFNSYFS